MDSTLKVAYKLEKSLLLDPAIRKPIAFEDVFGFASEEFQGQLGRLFGLSGAVELITYLNFWC